jgi:hypothetical protein
MNMYLWGAHAARVLVSAPSPKQSFSREVNSLPEKTKKFATREGVRIRQVAAATAPGKLSPLQIT